MAEKLYGLLGRRLGHSWSVPIHEAFGCKGYRLIELEPEDLGPFLRREDVGGLNVTIPYKQDVMACCDEIDPAAADIGSVNTLVRRGGKLYGYNTDIDGFLYMLRRARISLSGKKVLILGSGGASLTAQAAARREQAREIVVVSRTGRNNYDNLYTLHADAEAIINTTPVGMWPRLEGRPVDLQFLPAIVDVVDVIYNPARTNLLLQAEDWNRSGQYLDELGLFMDRQFRCTGGLSMLAAQAKRAEELFFGKTIPDGETEAIIRTLRLQMTNIVLVGMPGSGKTTAGQALAAASGKAFVDLDDEITRAAGKPIPEIFREDGEGVFRELEHRVLTETCAKSGQVIATGGGAVLRPENRQALRRTGWVCYLLRRLEDLPTSGRPLSQAGSLEEMFTVRHPLYIQAADTYIWNEASPQETAERIWRDFREH